MNMMNQTSHSRATEGSEVAVSPLFPYVIFDMDGTLVDTFNLIAESYDYAIGSLTRKQLDGSRASGAQGYTLEEALAKGLPVSDVPKALGRFHDYFDKNFNSRANVFPGIKRSLVALRRRGVGLAVFTGQTRRATEITLQRTDLKDFFTEIVTADDVTEPKPSPEGLKLAMEGIRADPDGTVYVGDDPDDVYASRGAGVKTAAALWGSVRRNELVALQPDFTFSKPTDVQLLSTWTIR
jgi:phosphoglycolate phosphatase-like HAD superfamily hydrolase